MTYVLVLLPLAAVLIVAPIVHRLVVNHIRRADRPVPFVQSDPLVSSGGRLPDFFYGHTWPVNPNRRSSR